MPRTPQKAWEKVPNKPLYRCKICGQPFETDRQAWAHVEQDCIPCRECAYCGGSLYGKRWHARFCSPSCRVMGSRKRKKEEAKKKAKEAKSRAEGFLDD